MPNQQHQRTEFIPHRSVGENIYLLTMEGANSPLLFNPWERRKILWLVCVCVSLSACVSQKSHLRTSPNFFVHSICGRGLVSSDDCTVHYILMVLWMTSCFHMHMWCTVRLAAKGHSWSAEAPVFIAPADWRPLVVIDAMHNRVCLCCGKQCIVHGERSLLSWIALLWDVALYK